MYQKEFNNHIRNLMDIEHNFIYKNNLELFRLFYTFLAKKYKDKELCLYYLELFDKISQININTIESNFSNLLLEFQSDSFYLYDLEQMEDYLSGLYFIYNEYEEIIYIGKSTNLKERALQSFLNKLPYGATYLKVIPFTNHLENVEGVAIDYFLPPYNNKFEKIDVSYRTYTVLVKFIERNLFQGKSHFITSKKVETNDETISVFHKD
jgi:hypothetical protein